MICMTNQETIKTFEQKEKEALKELDQLTQIGQDLLDKLVDGKLSTDEWVTVTQELHQNAIDQKRASNYLASYRQVLAVLNKMVGA